MTYLEMNYLRIEEKISSNFFSIKVFTIQEKKQLHERFAHHQQARVDEESEENTKSQRVKVNIFIKMGIMTNIR